jgi:hypothetical protein
MSVRVCEFESVGVEMRGQAVRKYSVTPSPPNSHTTSSASIASNSRSSERAFRESRPTVGRGLSPDRGRCTRTRRKIESTFAFRRLRLPSRSACSQTLLRNDVCARLRQCWRKQIATTGESDRSANSVLPSETTSWFERWTSRPRTPACKRQDQNAVEQKLARSSASPQAHDPETLILAYPHT